MNSAPPLESRHISRAWRWRHLLRAPHRLGFFLATAVLVCSGVWWALVQLDRAGGYAGGWRYAVSPTVLHASVMTFGFMPLFFAGFLFTAAPKWLGVRGPEAPSLCLPLVLQAAGWGAWIVGGHAHVAMALAGLGMAGLGLGWTVVLFWRLVVASVEADRLHAQVVGVAGLVGWLCLVGTGVALWRGEPDTARAWVSTGLWGFVVATYVTVVHRMIPFFTSSAVPMVTVWRPFWVLWMMLAAVVFEAAAVWVEGAVPGDGVFRTGWMLWRGLVEFTAGGIVLWLAVAWGLVQSLRIRLLAMLHIGFVWLGLAFMLGAASQWLGLSSGRPVLGLGALHALSMGCLGSLMLAMVTRVSCGHSGRALVADNVVWGMFWLLQVAVVLRIVGALPGATGAGVLGAALLWAGVMAVWGARHAAWYGRLRADGRPG